jgi:hypothetical protein
MNVAQTPLDVYCVGETIDAKVRWVIEHISNGSLKEIIEDTSAKAPSARIQIDYFMDQSEPDILKETICRLLFHCSSVQVVQFWTVICSLAR